ncbi:aminoglycoside phosphotransferase [Vallitalea longa]|uniref:Aminoglycoside phosphotransferase n=1 Tax=Vallitalea longa TaxID=2936439 RepID=A0A9W6DDF9_9FIRM|nr:phosphotransferase [Vallitalea longa]GKX28771.1 aminoglycoside phosphotransferase [Vallitalea longa]
MELGKLIGEGSTAEIYELDNNKILKLFIKGYKKKYIKYEYRVNNILSTYDLPVTKAYKMVKCNDRIGIIYDKVNGNTMLHNIFDDMSSIKTYGENLAKLHYTIHKVTYNKRLYNYKQSLIRSIKNIDLIDNDTKHKIIAYTKSLPDGSNLCHGDFHPENILIDNNKYYIIDWMTTRKGNCLCDVARTIIILKYSVVEKDIPIDEIKEFHVLRSLLLKHYVNFYTAFSGADINEIEKWELPIATTRLNENIPEEEKALLLEYINNQLKK